MNLELLSSYRSLSIDAVTAIFVTTLILFFTALIVLLVEMLWARFIRRFDDQKSAKTDDCSLDSRELNISVNALSLKLIFQNVDVLQAYLSELEKCHNQLRAKYRDSISEIKT
jgi:hypothetical protein